MMLTTGLDRERLRELARRRAGDGVGVSLFVDLDPTRFAAPPARKSQVTSLLDAARREAEQRELDHGQRMTVRNRLDRAGEALGDGSLFEGTHGLAVYVGFDGGDDVETIRLPSVVQPEESIDETPLVRPLVAAKADGRWCVVLVSRSAGRFFIGDGLALEERTEISDDVHGQHDQGGWSQARYERSVDEEFKHHLSRVATVALRLREAEPFDHLLIGGTEENVNALVEKLDGELATRYAGRFAVEVDGAGPDDVLERARDPMEKHRSEALARSMSELQEGLAKNTRAVAGLEPVLQALNERRVRKLLAARVIDAPGRRCPQCDLLAGADVESCPVDGTPTERRERILDDVVRKALGDSAEVRLLERTADVPSAIAALTHF